MYLYNDSLEFPAVTFCNLSPIKKHGLYCASDEELVELVRLEMIGSSRACIPAILELYFPIEQFWSCDENSTVTLKQGVKFCDGGSIQLIKGGGDTPPEGGPPGDGGDTPLEGGPSGDGGDTPLEGGPSGDGGDTPPEGGPSGDGGDTPLEGGPSGDGGDTPPEGGPSGDGGDTPLERGPFREESGSPPEGGSGMPTPSNTPALQDSPLDGEEEPQQVFEAPSPSATLSDTSGQLDQFKDNVFANLAKLSETGELMDIANMIIIPEDVVQNHGFTLDDMLISCSFNGNKCGKEHFRTILSGRHGLCHTFNPKPINQSGTEQTIRTEKYGFQNGLRLTLNIEAEEYLGLLTNAYGVRTAIHRPELAPQLDSKGINVGRGRMTSIGLMRTEISRLPHPYASQCQQDFPSYLTNYTLPAEPYTSDGCRTACKDYHLHQNCNCTDSVPYTVNEDATHTSTSNLCIVTDVNETECRIGIVDRLSSAANQPNWLGCTCKSECEETDYNEQISISDWPTSAYQKLLTLLHTNYALEDLPGLTSYLVQRGVLIDKSFQQKYEKFYGFYEPQTSDQMIATNLLQLHIYYKTLSYQRIVEEPSYTFGSFIADMGGILGLYIGMSIISFMEIFEAIYLGAYYYASKIRLSRHSQRKINAKESEQANVENIAIRRIVA